MIKLAVGLGFFSVWNDSQGLQSLVRFIDPRGGVSQEKHIKHPGSKSAAFRLGIIIFFYHYPVREGTRAGKINFSNGTETN